MHLFSFNQGLLAKSFMHLFVVKFFNLISKFLTNSNFDRITK